MSKEELFPCPVEGCDKGIQNKGALRMHIQQMHNMSPGDAQKLVDGAVAAPLGEAPKADESAPADNEKPLQETPAIVAELQQKLTLAEAKTMNDFTPNEKANFVITWGKALPAEDKALFAAQVFGITGTAVAEVEETEATEVKGNPNIIQGKTDKPGYKYLEYMNVSIKEI